MSISFGMLELANTLGNGGRLLLKHLAWPARQLLLVRVIPSIRLSSFASLSIANRPIVYPYASFVLQVTSRRGGTSREGTQG